MNIDFKVLNNLKDNKNGLREKKANQKIDKGFYYLKLADQESYTGKERIRQAAALFLEAIDYQRDDVRPYMGMAYIFALLNQYQNGLEFLDDALEIEPDNTAIAAFKVFCESEQQQYPVDLAAIELEQVDYDVLYEQTEDLLKHKIQEAGHLLIPAPSIQPQVINQLKENMHRVLSTQEQIQEKLQILDQEFNIGPLTQLAQSLQIVFQRLKNVYQTSKQLLGIQDKIQLTHQESKQLHQLLRKEGYFSPAYDQTLEQLLDRCDAIADKLDGFENNQIPISEVMPHYEKLIQDIQFIQDEMDELPQLNRPIKV